MRALQGKPGRTLGEGDRGCWGAGSGCTSWSRRAEGGTASPPLANARGVIPAVELKKRWKISWIVPSLPPPSAVKMAFDSQPYSLLYCELLISKQLGEECWPQLSVAVADPEASPSLFSAGWQLFRADRKAWGTGWAPGSAPS